LIGIHRQIGVGTDSNLHVSISSVLRVLKEAAPAQTSNGHDDPLVLSPDSMLPSSEVVAALRSHAITVVADESNARLISGTLMTSNLVATKLSELPDVKRFKCMTEADQQQQGDLWHSDRLSDLAIIRLAEPVEVQDIESTSESQSAPGYLIFSLTENRIPHVGVVSFAGQQEPDLMGRMGARFALTAEKSVVLSELFPNGAAALAGMHIDDQLQVINGQTIESLDDVAGALRSFQPGDRMTITLKRPISDPTMTSIRLHHDVGARFESTEFLDGRSGELSERRSGFASVIQHDIPVRPVDCGAPVCDSTGKIIGINIARRSREATLVLPIQKVQAVIQNHKDADSPLNRMPE
jgi:serine protease Do